MIVSEETANQLGQRLVDYIERSGQAPDLILGPADVRSSGVFDWFKRQIALNGLYVGAGIERRPGIGSFQEMEGTIYSSIPAAFITKRRDTNDKVCVVSAETRDFAGGYMFELLSKNKKFSDADKARLPGTSEDWRFFTMFHESDHCRPERLAVILNASENTYLASQAEYLADKDAALRYSQAYRDGIVSNPDVPYALRAIRAVYAMTSTDSKHSVSVLLPLLPGEESVIPDSSQAFDNVNRQMDKAKDSIFAEMGKDTANARTQLQALVLLNDDESLQTGISKEENERLRKVAYDRDGDPALVEALLRQYPVPAALEKERQRKIEAVYITDGRSIAATHPEVFYEYARRQLLRGDFNSDPVQKAFIERFVDAAERYFPNFYHVPEDRIKNGPVVSAGNNAQQTRPAPVPESPRLH